ncbi:SlyX family protein [Actomonas aquatica]|uniref:SlyX family protein n=1 Tax=Actomonas aquatica TaxID=2866162 RepID=A0ABZ1C567_9BACT|nr:SlyX family protein [Opitutus sp. WL0086]WRQ86510.1 SlyX family protein [Opitutus sp. WL0086]
MDEARVSRLEERIAWLERHVLEQDKVMLQQGDLVKKLRDELLTMRERVGGREVPLDPNERPPHY